MCETHKTTPKPDLCFNSVVTQFCGSKLTKNNIIIRNVIVFSTSFFLICVTHKKIHKQTHPPSVMWIGLFKYV